MYLVMIQFILSCSINSEHPWYVSPHAGGYLMTSWCAEAGKKSHYPLDPWGEVCCQEQKNLW